MSLTRRSARDPDRCRAAPRVTAALLANQAIAVVCQFIQGTDPRFPLWYFTVDSAILAGLGAAVQLCAPRAPWLAVLRHTAAVGVLISAVVFAAVIAPASPSGTWFQPHDDVVVRLATVLFHGVAPVLVTVDYALRPVAMRFRSAVARAFLWPVAYLLGLCFLVGILGQRVIPYPFLRPEVMGWGRLGLAVFVLTALVAGSGAVLVALNRMVWRNRISHTTRRT